MWQLFGFTFAAGSLDSFFYFISNLGYGEYFHLAYMKQHGKKTQGQVCEMHF